MKFKIWQFFSPIVIFFQFNNFHNNNFIEGNDNQKIKRISNLLKKYYLSIFEDELEEWDNPLEIEKLAIYKIKQAVVFFKKDKFVTKDEDIDYEKINLLSGYKLDLSNKTLKVEMQYGNSIGEEFLFNVWKVKKTEVISAINEKIIQNINVSQFYENNWNSSSFVSNLGLFYHESLLNAIGKTIKVKEYEIPINHYRIYFESWTNDLFVKNNILLNYRYFLESPPIILKVQLKYKFNGNKLIPQITDYLEKNNFLTFNLNQTLFWNSNLNWTIILKNYLDKLTSLLKVFLKTLNYEVEKIDLTIETVSPFGPFENQVKVFLSVNKSITFVPLKINFNNKIISQDFSDLETVLNNKLSTLFIVKNHSNQLSNGKLLNILKKSIGNQIDWKNDIVPFDSNNLVIKNFVILEKKLLVNLLISQYSYLVKIYINLI